MMSSGTYRFCSPLGCVCKIVLGSSSCRRAGKSTMPSPINCGNLGVVDGKPAIGVNSGSIWPTKRWWLEGFAEFIGLVKTKLDCQVLLFGGPGRCRWGQAIVRAQRRRGARHCRQVQFARTTRRHRALPGFCHQRQRPDAYRRGTQSADGGAILCDHARPGVLSLQRQLHRYSETARLPSLYVPWRQKVSVGA